MVVIVLFFVDLILDTQIVTNVTQTICFGDTVMIGDSAYYSTGAYQTVLTAANGCDSLVDLSLTVEPQKCN